MIDPNNRDIVHHVVLMECNLTVVFDDNNLPDGICDEIIESILPYATNVTAVWTVGGDEELGYLTLGASVSYSAIAIPPEADRFILDSYCPAEATENFPEPVITVLAAFPHTHLQDLSIWTKLIRNKKVVESLFNAEAYDFNYQFDNHLPKPIQLYP
ncbi:unnamed protein product, partial [Rotaria sp. Silwood2]